MPSDEGSFHFIPVVWALKKAATHAGFHLRCGPNMIMNGAAWYSTSILNWAVNQMITLSISVHPPVAFFSQSQTSCMMIARLSFWCHIRKQMISPSTQIIGEKPQTVSGPLWVIVLLSVKLALMTVSHVVRRVIYPAGLGVTGLQHWRQLRGRGGGQVMVTPVTLPSHQPQAHLTWKRLQFPLYLPGGPKAEECWGGEWRGRVLVDL